MLLAEIKLNTIEVQSNSILILTIFFLVNNILEEYHKTKKETKNLATCKPLKTYCISCEKHTEEKNSNLRKTKQNRIMLLLNCAVCGKKKLIFINNKELQKFD